MNKHFGTLLKSTIGVTAICSTLYVGSRITNINDTQTVVSPPIQTTYHTYDNEYHAHNNYHAYSNEPYAGIIKIIHDTTTAPNPIYKEETEEETVTCENPIQKENDKKSKSNKSKKQIKEKEIEPIINYTSTGVNLRKDPNTESEIIRVLPRNTEVIKIAKNGKWSKVEYIYDITQQDGVCSYVGYIHNDYLSNEKLPNRWNITLTSDEIVLLEKIVFREAGNQSLVGQEAVAEVILNRMISDKYPDTLYEVLSQSGQFSSWSVRNVGTPTDSVKKAVQEVLDGNTNILSSNYLYFSRGGHSTHKGVVRIGDHQFCPVG